MDVLLGGGQIEVILFAQELDRFDIFRRHVHSLRQREIQRQRERQRERERERQRLLDFI